MIYLIIAQIGRGTIIWVRNPMTRKIIKTLIVLAVMGYLIERTRKQKEIDERRLL